MERVENECVGCKDMGRPCAGVTCPRRNVHRFYCDKCGTEETLYEYDNQQLCAECLLEGLKKVEGS